MTEHLMAQDTIEDQRTLRRLGLVILCFLAFTAAMAVGVGVALS